MEILIKANGINKSFKNRKVLNYIDFSIYSGETIALIGPNGAGKTTLINVLLGILKPEIGNIKMWRKDYKSHIGFQLQTTPFFDGYTSMDNFILFSALYNIKLKKEHVTEILKKLNLNKYTQASKLSGGEQKKLAIALAAIHSPELLILDEPTSGLDPRESRNVRDMIKSFSTKKGMTILFTSHYLEEVEDIASRIIFLYDGKIVADGNKEELLEKYNMDNLEKLYILLTENKEAEL